MRAGQAHCSRPSSVEQPWRDPARADGLLVQDSEAFDDDEPDAPDDGAADRLARQALALEERSEIERMLALMARLPPDTKVEALRAEVARLREEGYGQVMVFTRFTDTMDFLRAEMGRDAGLRIMCFSGRGGEIPASDGGWRRITRDEVKRRFREGQADLLLCTDTAAESPNFQFCGALVNYDSPLNPMRIEQRIGRIDRLGQQFELFQIVNLHYADTVEANVCQALRTRINLFAKVVGGLQPILARMPGLIRDHVLNGRMTDLAREVERGAGPAEGGFELDEVAAVEPDDARDEPPAMDHGRLGRCPVHGGPHAPGRSSAAAQPA